MNVKKSLWLFLLHLELFVLGTALFILLFQTELAKSTTVLFYRGIILLSIVTLFTFFVGVGINFALRGKTFSLSDALLSSVLIFCLNLVFFTHLPVTAERSVSTFLLGYMNENSDREISEEEMAKVLIDKYIYEHEGVRKRFDEQTVSGNIFNSGSGYRITSRGKFVMSVYNFVTDLFRISKKNIFP